MTVFLLTVGMLLAAFILTWQEVRRWVGLSRLAARYQARANRSVVLSVLWPDPWTRQPYPTGFLPEDV